MDSIGLAERGGPLPLSRARREGGVLRRDETTFVCYASAVIKAPKPGSLTMNKKRQGITRNTKPSNEEKKKNTEEDRTRLECSEMSRGENNDMTHGRAHKEVTSSCSSSSSRITSSSSE